MKIQDLDASRVCMDWLGNDFPFSENALSGKHAIVCRASKGIGKATAQMLAKAGAQITLVSRNPNGVSSELNGDNHTEISLDLEDEISISKFISTIEKCDILINNAAGPPGVLCWIILQTISSLHSSDIYMHLIP